MREQWQIDQGAKCGCEGANEYCGCQNVSPDQRIEMQMQKDDLKARAENAEADLKSLRDRLDQALGSYERDANRTLLLERLYELAE